jgi:hypothetical protein
MFPPGQHARFGSVIVRQRPHVGVARRETVPERPAWRAPTVETEEACRLGARTGCARRPRSAFGDRSRQTFCTCTESGVPGYHRVGLPAAETVDDLAQRLPDGCPCANATSRAPTEAGTRLATSTRGRGARVPSLTRPPPAEADEDRAHKNARTGCPCAFAHATAASRSGRGPSSRKRADGVPVCRRSHDRRQPKLAKTELTTTRGRGARWLPSHRVLRPRSKPARQHRLADGVSVCCRSPDHRQPKLTKTELTETRGRCPFAAAHQTTASRSQRRPSSRKRADGVPACRRSRDRRQPKPAKTELTETRGRVCPFAGARTRSPPTEADDDRADGKSRTVSVCRRSRDQRRPKPTKAELTETQRTGVQCAATYPLSADRSQR